jgi:hypothetical protein
MSAQLLKILLILICCFLLDSRTQEGIQNQWTYHRPKVYPIKYHGVGNQMHWNDPLGLRQHTDFCQGQSSNKMNRAV